MKPEKHIEDARAIESSVIKLDEEKDYKLIVEGIYGAAINYIAYICEKLLKEHRDTHKVLPKFLEDNNLNDLAKQFRILDQLRLGRWYGGKTNGNTSKFAKLTLEKIKKYVKNE